MRIGRICQFPDVSVPDDLELDRELGIDELDLFSRELDAEVGRFVAQAREAGVPVTALSPRWGWIDRALQDPSELDRLQTFIEAAPRLGTERIMLSCSFVKPESEQQRAVHEQRVIEIYKAAASIAEAAAVDLCTHTTTRPGITFGTVQGIDRFLEGVGSARNRLLFCSGCISVAGWDTPDLIRHWRGAIGAVHLFNPVGTWDHYEEMRFDRGQLDLPAVLSALQGAGYEGVLLPHEYPAFSGTCGEAISDGWVVGYLRAVLQTLEGPAPT